MAGIGAQTKNKSVRKGTSTLLLWLLRVGRAREPVRGDQLVVGFRTLQRIHLFPRGTKILLACLTTRHLRQVEGLVPRKGAEARATALLLSAQLARPHADLRSALRNQFVINALTILKTAHRGVHMQQAFQQLLQLLQQGIAAIFRIVEAVWSWAAAQITNLMQSPWQNWPLWKQVLLAVIAVAVVFALYKAAVQLWIAGERILAGFAALLTALVRTIPSLAVAGLIAVGGVWLLNNLDLSNVRMPAWQTTSVGDKSSPN